MSKKILGFMPLAICILIGLTAVMVLKKGPEIHTLKSPMTEKVVPFFESDGFGHKDLKGQVTILNFFASWCGPCAIEHPLIMRLSQAGVSVYGVGYRDDPDLNKAYLSRMGNPYKKLAHDLDGKVSIAFGVSGVPTTMVIDRAGIIRYRLDGPVMQQDIDRDILPLIGELKK